MSKNKQNKIQSIFSIVDGFQSPILLSNLSIPTDLDRKLVRSFALFGDSDSFRDTLRRNPTFQHRLNSTAKKAARERRRYLLSVKKHQPEKFERFCTHYNIPFQLSCKNLSPEFEKTNENTSEKTYKKTNEESIKGFNNTTMELAVKSYSAKCKYSMNYLICNINRILISFVLFCY